MLWDTAAALDERQKGSQDLISAQYLSLCKEVRADLDQRHPLGHFGQPKNIGDAIAFLASDKAAFMTGAEMVVDGGWTAQ